MLILRLALLAACVAFAGAASASAPATLAPDLRTLTTVPRHELPASVVQQALAAAAAHPQRDRFAVGIPLGLELTHGLWEPLDVQTSRWRLRLASPGAVSISAHLFPLELPEGTQFWIYNPGGEQVYGPYTQADIPKLGFWTPLIFGDEMVLEVHSPALQANHLRLEVAEGFHGYKSLDKANAGGPGTSDSCNHDAVCQTATWGDESRSSAMMTFSDGSGLSECSGQLLNNVRQDFTTAKKLFLTARHCGIGHSGPADSVVFYFNYQNSTCDQARPAGSGTPFPTSSADAVTGGAMLLADDLQADFALLKVNGTLPGNVYFAGWDATITPGPASSGAAIHYPNSDDKKISLFDSIVQSTVDIGESCLIDAWQVHWNYGTTQQGSSGGGLWDGVSHDVIGVLSGGNAACAATPDCPTCGPDKPDYFARFDRAWVANSDASGQLKAWLDPDGTCIAKIPGLDPGTNSNPAAFTTSDNPPHPIRCTGQASTCFGPASRTGGGGSAGTLLIGMLGGLLFRMRRRRTLR